MRTPAMLGDLLPVAVPGLIVVGAASMLVMQTRIGPQIFGGPIVFLLLSLLVGILVVGYLVAGLQEVLAGRLDAWTLPPASHLDFSEHRVLVPSHAFERAGFTCQEAGVAVPLGAAYALERALAGAWGTPEGAGWDRVAFLQRITLALGLSAVLALAFMLGGLAAGGLDPGLRSHGGTVLVFGAVTAYLVGRRVARARREAIIDLLADARALLLDRGEQKEVRRVLNELDLTLKEEDAGVGIPR